MRRIVMAACVLGLLICGSWSVAQAQSLKETTDWLHDFLQSREPLRSRDGNWRDIYQLVANGCEVTISLEVHDLSCLKPKNGCDGEAKEEIHRQKRVFNLKD